MKRFLEYLRGTIDMPLRLGADSLNKFMTWVVSSFAIHPDDMRSHTGGVIYLESKFGSMSVTRGREHVRWYDVDDTT